MFAANLFGSLEGNLRRGSLYVHNLAAAANVQREIDFKLTGRLHLDAEFGPRASTVGRSEWLAGIVCGFDLAKPTMLMAELFDESRMNFSHDVLTLNVGLRHEFTENYILIMSMGHELRSPDQPTALLGYFGMQFVY